MGDCGSGGKASVDEEIENNCLCTGELGVVEEARMALEDVRLRRKLISNTEIKVKVIKGEIKELGKNNE